MRVLVYKAAAYGALLMAGAEAFAPQSCGAGALRMQMGDAADILARADAMMQGKDALMNGQSLQMAAASLETSYAAPAAANPADSKSGWKPYGGYDPKNRQAAAAPAPAPAAAYTPPAQEMAAAYAQAAPAPAAPASSWSPPQGYVPKGAGASDPLSSAPAKKWQPYGGYDPKSRGPPASTAVNPAYAPAAASYEAPAQSFASAG